MDLHEKECAFCTHLFCYTEMRLLLISSIAMDAEYLSYAKFVATRAPTFFGYIISVLASVHKEQILK